MFPVVGICLYLCVCVYLCVRIHCLFFFSLQFIKGGTSIGSDDVVELKSKAGVQKFSVKGANSVEFVSLFSVSKSNRQIVQCHSSIWNASKSCKREVTRLNDETICDYLRRFREYLEQNEELLYVNDTLFTSGFLSEEKVKIIIKNDTWGEHYQEIYKKFGILKADAIFELCR